MRYVGALPDDYIMIQLLSRRWLKLSEPAAVKTVDESSDAKEDIREALVLLLWKAWEVAVAQCESSEESLTFDTSCVGNPHPALCFRFVLQGRKSKIVKIGQKSRPSREIGGRAGRNTENPTFFPISLSGSLCLTSFNYLDFRPFSKHNARCGDSERNLLCDDLRQIISADLMFLGLSLATDSKLPPTSGPSPPKFTKMLPFCQCSKEKTGEGPNVTL